MIQKQQDRFNWNDTVWNQAPDHFDTRQPDVIRHWAQRSDLVNLHPLNTFYLLDTRKGNYPENTIIFDTQRGMIKTPKTSHELIAGLIRQMSFGDRHLTRMLIDKLEFSRSRMPVIKGDAEFVPLGPVSREATNWVGVHQVTAVQPGQLQTQLTFCHQLQLIVKQSHYQLERQFKEAHRLREHLMSEYETQNRYRFSQSFETTRQSLMSAAKHQQVYDLCVHMLTVRGYPIIPAEINLDIERYFGKL